MDSFLFTTSDRLWEPPQPPANGYMEGSYSRVKRLGRESEGVEVQLHSPIRLHGVVLR